MKKLSLAFAFITSTLIAQTNTEVYVFDILKTDSGIQLTKKRNISNNIGYDSQPHFYNNNTILFAATRNGQTDILKYSIKSEKKVFINSTPNGGEYSPQRIPGSKNISAVRLDTTGLQRFYEYDIKTGQSKVLIENLVVAYPYWHKKNLLISSVIGKNSLNLVISDLKNKTNATIVKNIGRSIHRIPSTNSVSYISKKNPQWEIHSLDTETLESTKLVEIDGKYEDICWLSDGTILLAKKNQILKFNTKSDKEWTVFVSINDPKIKKISRITVSPDGHKISIVAE